MPPPLDYPIMRIIPSNVETHYYYQCEVCPERFRESYVGWAFMEPSSGELQNGWMQIAPGKWICPKHDVRIIIDGVDSGNCRLTEHGMELPCPPKLRDMIRPPNLQSTGVHREPRGGEWFRCTHPECQDPDHIHFAPTTYHGIVREILADPYPLTLKECAWINDNFGAGWLVDGTPENREWVAAGRPRGPEQPK